MIKWGCDVTKRKSISTNCRVGSAIAVAGVVVVSLVVPPPERGHAPLGPSHDQVHSAVMLLSVVGSSNESNGIPAGLGSAEIGDLSNQVNEVMRPTARQAAEDDFWASPLGFLLIGANLLVLPVWFLATPITLPLAIFAAASQVPADNPFGVLAFLLNTAVGFLLGPLGVIDVLTRNSASAAAVQAAASVSVDPTEEPWGQAANVEHLSGNSQDQQAGRNNAGASVREGKTPRGRIATRILGEVPLSAAAISIETPEVTPVIAGSSGKQETDAGDVARGIGAAADPTDHMDSKGSSAKARAKLRSGR